MPGQGSPGKGNSYWKYAAFHPDLDSNDSNSSGWFIDAVEGFVPINCTEEMYGHESNKRFDAVQDPDAHFNCMWMAGRNNYADDPTPNLQKCLGVNTYEYSPFNKDYLDLDKVRAPVKKNGDNIVQTSNKQGGGASPSKGIEGNYMHFSYAGINPYEEEDNLGGNGMSDWADINWYFTDMVTHASQVEFINKITQPGAVWGWHEDPGEILYKTESITTDYPKEEFWNGDSRRGIAMYNYVAFADYWMNDHHRYRGEYSCFFGLVSGSCNSWKQTLVSRSKTSDVVGSASSDDDPWLEWDCNCDEVVLEFDGCCGHHRSPLNPIDARCPEHYKCNVDSANWTVATPGGMNWLDPIGSLASGYFTCFDSHHHWPVGAYDWDSAYNKRRRFLIKAYPINKTTGTKMTDAAGNYLPIGGVEPHFYKPTNNPANDAHFDVNGNAITSNPNTGHSFTDPTYYPGTT